jgi:hypothetical protein
VHIPPSTWRRFHAGMTVAWVVLVLPTVVWWRDSVLWVALMSIWANVVGHWSAYQATRAEENGS